MWADLVRGGFIQEGAINWVLKKFYLEEGKPFQAKGMNSIINGMFADSETVLLRVAKGFVKALWKYLSLVCGGITSQKLFLSLPFGTGVPNKRRGYLFLVCKEQ